VPLPRRRPVAAVLTAAVAVLGVVSVTLVPAGALTVRSFAGGTRTDGSVRTSATASPTASTPDAASAYGGTDPSTWSDHRLAAQLVFSCVDLGDLDAARRQARAGIGGIVLLGSRPPSRLRARLAAVRDASRTAVLPFVASDEEGGTVQRLRDVIYPLPSARTMGGWSPARVRRTAHDYGVRMRRLGVRMDLAPVADLSVRGAYIASLRRAFSADPDRVTARARAWRLGMRDAGVVTVLKHWPGHGSAPNSHNGPARVAPLADLERADLLPFDSELADGAPVVMVGHLLSAGLTRDGVPTSESPHALRYLRRTAGPDAVILTDSLSMAAASSSLGISPVRATVRALRAGADWAMACDGSPLRAVAAVRDALASGALPREQAAASARRILAVKARWGLAPHSHS
jgi:beta-N-acetylhexosaminidase